MRNRNHAPTAWASALIGICLIARPSWAQSQPAQDPVNAHAFAARVMTNGTGSVYVWADDNYSQNLWQFHGFTSNACTTRFGTGHAPYAGTMTINWSTIRTVEAVADRVKLVGQMLAEYPGWASNRVHTEISFSVGTPEMAARLQRAFTVLRTSCDRTQGLGF
jgi:hypothetical protein